MIPVEYAVAVERFLFAAEIGGGSCRVYRIALATWAWLLVECTPPVGPERRRAAPPVVPLALLDGPQAVARLQAAFAERSATVGPRTANRELSILRSAVAWWLAQGWLGADPTAGVHPQAVPAVTGRLGEEEVRTVLALRVPLRDKVFWHLVHETGAPIERLLTLDVNQLDLLRRRARPANAEVPPVRWRGGTARVLPMLVVGRIGGPLFLTDRRAPAGTPPADRCPHTGRARLSYRRAAELFTHATRPLDPAGRGWTLRQLQG